MLLLQVIYYLSLWGGGIIFIGEGGGGGVMTGIYIPVAREIRRKLLEVLKNN